MDKNWRVLGFIAGSFTAGLLLLAFVDVWHPDAPSWQTTLHHVLRELGFALVVASIVASIFELFLSGERDERLRSLMGDYQEMYDFGFRKIFVDRQNVFDELIASKLKTANHVRIIGICVSIFKEFERSNQRQTNDSPVDYFASRILNGQRLEILMLKRDPHDDDLRTYGLQTGDFYRMREWDEDKPESFSGGRRLRKIANQAIGQWIEVLVSVAERSAELEEESRREALHRMVLKEYVAMPSVSLYIVDEEIFVTPYLYRRHCSSVPAFSVAGRATRLYREYLAHFTETWKSSLTCPSIRQDFVEALTKDPQVTASAYRSELVKIRREFDAALALDPNFVESVEYFRAEERAMLVVAERLSGL